MIIRKLEKSDLLELERIYQKFQSQKFKLPDPVNLIGMRSAVSDGELVGAGLIKNLYEAVVFLDLDKSKRLKLEALSGLLESAKAHCLVNGIDQLVAFIPDPTYRDLLVEHFGFNVLEGTPLILEVGDGTK